MEPADIFKLILAITLAIIPACAWAYIFAKKQPGHKVMTLRTFAFGALFVTPLLGYKYLWQYFPWLNAFEYTHPFQDDLVGFASFGLVPLSVILTFMIVGVIEETTKLWAMKAAGSKHIRSIDDAIEMCVTAALGFSFVENILYFYNIMSGRGVGDILYPFVFRSLFSTFAHVMFSGILGYYYGQALFAGEVLQEKHNQKRWPFAHWFARLIHCKKQVLFREEKLAEGLLIAICLHAIFNIFLEMNWTFLIIPFLTAGYIYLSWLLEKKEDHKVYGLLQQEAQHG